ncbi:hypothetical protein AAHA92_31361 [Salvia divinorum]|uniref:Uncharacterized protein n=1 Tax=Salvia divinorum TaxID=28513 RepID=A0ABD1FWQ9_SALDI
MLKITKKVHLKRLQMGVNKLLLGLMPNLASFTVYRKPGTLSPVASSAPSPVSKTNTGNQPVIVLETSAKNTAAAPKALSKPRQTSNSKNALAGALRKPNDGVAVGQSMRSSPPIEWAKGDGLDEECLQLRHWVVVAHTTLQQKKQKEGGDIKQRKYV